MRSCVVIKKKLQSKVFEGSEQLHISKRTKDQFSLQCMLICRTAVIRKSTICRCRHSFLQLNILMIYKCCFYKVGRYPYRHVILNQRFVWHSVLCFSEKPQFCFDLLLILFNTVILEIALFHRGISAKIGIRKQ